MSLSLGIGLSLTSQPRNAFGPNIVINGGFDTDTDWNKGTGWSISGGDAVATSVPAFVSISQTSVPFVAGISYEVTFEITEYTSGQVSPSFSGGTQVTGALRSSVGIFTETLTANAGNNQLNLQARSIGFTGKINYITVREIL